MVNTLLKYQRQGCFDVKEDAEDIRRVYAAGYTLRRTARGTVYVLEWEGMTR